MQSKFLDEKQTGYCIWLQWIVDVPLMPVRTWLYSVTNVFPKQRKGYSHFHVLCPFTPFPGLFLLIYMWEKNLKINGYMGLKISTKII